MGLFDFEGSKPKVTGQEYHQKVKAYLSEKGFKQKDFDRLDGFFQGSMHEGGVQKGVDEHEISQTIEWMRSHPHEHHFDEHKIDTIEHALRKHL